jgi:hypothetical protein
MKYIIIVTICLNLVAPNRARGENFIRTGVVQNSSVLRSGKSLVQFGVDEKKIVVYVVVYPNGGVSMSPVVDPLNANLALKIRYKGLNFDGPCECRPLVVITEDEVNRSKLKKIEEGEFLKTLTESKDLDEFVNALR